MGILCTKIIIWQDVCMLGCFTIMEILCILFIVTNLTGLYVYKLAKMLYKNNFTRRLKGAIILPFLHYNANTSKKSYLFYLYKYA